jgi:exopolysaccharide biosynthesis polyprenyl glycosylphosphotransferase
MLERLAHRLAGSVLIWDLIFTMMCLRVASSIRLWLNYGNSIEPEQVQLPWQIYLAVAAIWIIIFLLLTPQRAIFSSELIEAIGRLVAAIGLASLVFAGLLYLSFRDVSRLLFLYFVASDLVALLIYHLLIRTYSHRRQRLGWQRRVLLVGAGPAAQRLADEFARRPWAGAQVVGCTSDEPPAEDGIPVLGPVGATERLVVSERIDEVIFTLPPQQQEQVANLSLRIEQPVMLHMVPGLLDLAFARTPVETLGGIPLISLRESALTEGQTLLKRLFDISASAILLTLLAPVMGLIALLIKFDSPGPVFFLQERIGEHGRRFRMIKFRSMYTDAEQSWEDVAQRDADGRLLHKSSEDPRVTRIGRKLRRASLDELPQLINVLRGEMSLVGPRPEIPYIAAEYEPWQRQRLRVLPGMTGWWQVNGRSEKPMHLYTEEDLYYIQNYSFWLDLRILFKTVLIVWRGDGAY